MNSKLAELRAARKELQSKGLKEAQDKIDAQLIADEEAIAKQWVAGMKTLELPFRTVLVRKPSVHEYDRFIDSKMEQGDHMDFVRAALVYPTVEELHSSYPAYIMKVSKLALELSGAFLEDQEGK